MMLRPLAELKFAALSSTHIAKYRDARLKDVAGATVNKELNIIAHALETARREWGIHIPENPVRLVRRPQGAKPRDRRLVEMKSNAFLLHARMRAIHFYYPSSTWQLKLQCAKVRLLVWIGNTST